MCETARGAQLKAISVFPLQVTFCYDNANATALPKDLIEVVPLRPSLLASVR